ncbi:MAG: hypothetical protein BRD45_04225 [Bacteroidetes bacterium QS_8_64_10]|nr:MAG: hypothetical protein BRD45_04225 [Bacteroidetes bacterium QS_8_64_10]
MNGEKEEGRQVQLGKIVIDVVANVRLAERGRTAPLGRRCHHLNQPAANLAVFASDRSIFGQLLDNSKMRIAQSYPL